MPDAFSDYAEEQIINWALRGTAPDTAPSSVFVGLHTGDPGDDGAANELVDGADGYARTEVSTTGGFDAPSDGVTQNTAEIVVGPAAGGDWGTITHWSIWDAVVAGNCLFKDELQAPQDVADGDSARFAAGGLQVIVS